MSTGLLCAQQAAQPASKAPAPASQITHLTIFVLPAIGTCPVGMHATQGSSMQVLHAADGTTQPLMTPTLTLKGHDPRQIVEAP